MPRWLSSVSFQPVLAEPYLPAANCVKEESACVAALLHLLPCLFRGAALHNGAGWERKTKRQKHGIARRVTRPLAAVRRVLVVPERLRADPGWSK